MKSTEQNRKMPIKSAVKSDSPLVTNYLDARPLNIILERRCYWNNAEVGCHIEIDRSPNTFWTDVQTMIRFLTSELENFSCIVFLNCIALMHR